MDDRRLFEDLEIQQEHILDLTIALREGHGGLDSLRDKVKALLLSKYAGKSVVGIRRTFFLDSFGEVASLEIATPEPSRQAMSDAEIDRIMCADWQPRFGFGPFSHREPTYIGWDDDCAVVRNGEIS